MADAKRRNPRDRGGAWFVDTTCIDCDAARQVAPGLVLEDEDGLSYFAREPATPEEFLAAWRAVLVCPTASVGAPRGAKAPEDAFPWEVAPRAWLLGYNAQDSFGANAYFVERPEGNLMVDGPRWVPRLAEWVRARGGLAHVLLTHRDDVADAERYARELGARVWVHEEDADAAPNATGLISGLDAREVARGVTAVPIPGHTRGSVAFVTDDGLLFSGDSLYWSRATDDLAAFPDATWYSWDAQTESLARLAEHAFEHVLPGHGDRGSAPASEMRRRLLALVERMRGGRRAQVAAW